MLSITVTKFAQLEELKAQYLKAVEEYQDYHASGVFFLDNLHVPQNNEKSVIPLGVSIHMKIYAGANEILTPKKVKR